jgi:hypothetical protein
MDEFCCCRAAVSVPVLFCPLQERLLKVEALAESGVVEGEDGDEPPIAKSLGKGSPGDAEFEMSAGFVKIAD